MEPLNQRAWRTWLTTQQHMVFLLASSGAHMTTHPSGVFPRRIKGVHKGSTRDDTSLRGHE